MAWSAEERVRFVKVFHELWPSKDPAGELDKLFCDKLERFPVEAAIQSLRQRKSVEDVSRKPTLKAIEEIAKGLAPGGQVGPRYMGTSKWALVAQLVENHSGKIWQGEKARVRIEAHGFHLTDKLGSAGRPNWTLPYADVTEADLRRVLADLERGPDQEKEIADRERVILDGLIDQYKKRGADVGFEEEVPF